MLTITKTNNEFQFPAEIKEWLDSQDQQILASALVDNCYVHVPTPQKYLSGALGMDTSQKMSVTLTVEGITSFSSHRAFDTPEEMQEAIERSPEIMDRFLESITVENIDPASVKVVSVGEARFHG